MELLQSCAKPLICYRWVILIKQIYKDTQALGTFDEAYHGKLINRHLCYRWLMILDIFCTLKIMLYECLHQHHWSNTLLTSRFWRDITGAIKMPAFWEYPVPLHDYPYYRYISGPFHSQSNQNKVKVTNLKKYWPKFKFCNFAQNLTCDTYWEIIW